MFIVPKGVSKVSSLYYIDKGRTELVRAYVEPVVGAFSCKHGQVTGMSCGVISQVNVGNSPAYGCPANFFGKSCSATYVAMRGVNLKGSKGDSGGAVYTVKDNVNHPVGIISSGANTQQGAVTVFSPLTHLAGMGIRLKTQ